MSSLPSFVEENVEPCTFKLQICLKILGYLLLISRDGIYFKIKKKIQYALTSCVYGGTLMLYNIFIKKNICQFKTICGECDKRLYLKFV